MKKFIVKSYGKKGQDVVDKNYAAVDRGGEYKQLAIDPAWANLADNAKVEDDAPAFVKELVRPIKHRPAICSRCLTSSSMTL